MIKPSTTKVRCPRCRSNNLLLVETGTWSSQFVVTGGQLDRGEGNHDPESVDRLEAKCRDCGHMWKVRGASQIIDVVTEIAP